MSETPQPWWDPHRPAGFRLSLFDAVVLVLCAPLTWLLYRLVGSIAFMVPIVVAHFFLFCNVVRVGRWGEMLWGATFIVNVSAWEFFDTFTWPRVLLVQLPFTGLTLMTSFLTQRYHGIGWRYFRSLRARRHQCL